jgi:hypothetical protein
VTSAPCTSETHPGFVIDARLDGNERIVTFFSGAVQREPLVHLDEEASRLVYGAGDSPLGATHYSASLQVRLDPEEADALLAQPHAQPFEMGGRAMEGRLRIDAEGVRTKRQLERCVRRRVAYARSLPSKWEYS